MMASSAGTRRRRAYLWYGLVAAAAIGIAAARPMSSTQPGVVVRAEQAKSIVRLDPESGRTRTLYRSPAFIESHTVQVAADGRVAFAEGADGFDAATSLVVIGPDGALLHRGEGNNVRQLVWCCGADQVAVITGPRVEGGIGFRPQGVSLIDVRTGREQRLQGIPDPYRLHYAPSSRALYVRVLATTGAPTVYRYDAASGRVSATRHHAAEFSPDGEYYVDSEADADRFRVFRTRDDADVTDHLRLPREIGPHERGRWIPDADHALAFTTVTYPPVPAGERGNAAVLLTPEREAKARGRIRVVDVESGRVVESLSGRADTQWRTSAAALPVDRRGRVHLLRPLDQRTPGP